jgi:uncharacterized membrane protein (UPF0127 family)
MSWETDWETSREVERETDREPDRESDGGLRVRLACSLPERLCGLLKKGVCANGEVLALLPCKSIHTFGMKEALDVAFIDRQGCVLQVVRELPAGRLLACKTAVCTLERRSSLGGPWFEVGDTVKLLVR